MYCIVMYYVIKCNFNYILFTKLPWLGTAKGLRSSSQAVHLSTTLGQNPCTTTINVQFLTYCLAFLS